MEPSFFLPCVSLRTRRLRRSESARVSAGRMESPQAPVLGALEDYRADLVPILAGPEVSRPVLGQALEELAASMQV